MQSEVFYSSQYLVGNDGPLHLTCPTYHQGSGWRGIANARCFGGLEWAMPGLPVATVISILALMAWPQISWQGGCALRARRHCENNEEQQWRKPNPTGVNRKINLLRKTKDAALYPTSYNLSPLSFNSAAQPFVYLTYRDRNLCVLTKYPRIWTRSTDTVWCKTALCVCTAAMTVNGSGHG